MRGWTLPLVLGLASAYNYNSPSLRLSNTAAVSPATTEPPDLTDRNNAEAVGAWDHTLLAHAPQLQWPAPSPTNLRNEGVVKYNHALSRDKAAALRDICEQRLHASLEAVNAGILSDEDVFNKILVRGGTRCDLKLHVSEMPLHPVIADALADLTSLVGPSIREALGCDNPVLAELGAIRSTTGAPRQPIHADTGTTNEPVLLTTFVALQDVDQTMGPTTFLPATHNDEDYHNALATGEPIDRANLLSSVPHRIGTMDAGSCTLYDSRLLHGGGPNHSPPDREARWLLYFSFSPSEALAAELRGSSFGKLQEAKYTLNSLRGVVDVPPLPEQWRSPPAELLTTATKSADLDDPRDPLGWTALQEAVEQASEVMASQGGAATAAANSHRRRAPPPMRVV